MILVTLYSDGQLVPDGGFTVESRDAAETACKLWVDRPGRSAFFEGSKSTGGITGGYWHDGTGAVFTPRSGPARTERQTLPSSYGGAI